MSQTQAVASHAKKYTGGCHCGAVRFEATLDLEQPVGRCNCTICTKRSASGTIVKPIAFRVVAGEGDLTRYGKEGHPNAYYFCRRCGIQLFGKGDIPELGGEFVSVNVNALDEVDPMTLKVIYWDGRHDNWHAGPRESPWPIAS